MKYDFDSCIDRTKVMSIKWSSKLRQEMYGESDVIPLGIADMDFKAAPAVAKAIQDRAAHENYGYGYLADEFLMACVNWQKRRNHWDIKKEWITSLCPGRTMWRIMTPFAIKGKSGLPGTEEGWSVYSGVPVCRIIWAIEAEACSK